jgi:hypothetical protein
MGEILENLRGAPDELDWFFVSPPANFGSFVSVESRGRYRVGGYVLWSTRTESPRSRARISPSPSSTRSSSPSTTEPGSRSVTDRLRIQRMWVHQDAQSYCSPASSVSIHE